MLKYNKLYLLAINNFILLSISERFYVYLISNDRPWYMNHILLQISKLQNDLELLIEKSSNRKIKSQFRETKAKVDELKALLEKHGKNKNLEEYRYLGIILLKSLVDLLQ